MTDSSVPVKPQATSGSGAVPMVLLLVAIGAVLGLPALVGGVVLGLVARGRRILVGLVLLLAVVGGGLLYMRHAVIWAEMQAFYGLIQTVVQREAPLHDLWVAVRGLWMQTWPAAPVIALLLLASLPRSAAAQARATARRAMQQQQRAAQSLVERATRAPEAVAVRGKTYGVVGAAGAGSAESPFRAAGTPWVVYPPELLNKHGVVVGESGTGKSQFFLRLAYLAARVYGWRVYVIDAKGSGEFAKEFYATMQQAGVDTVALFPQVAYDGWRGDANLLYNRLVGCLDFSEPYYKNTLEAAVRLAVHAAGEPPRTAEAFLARLSVDYLLAAYADDPGALQRLERLERRHLASAAMRFDAFFASAGGAFDGAWAFEDVRAGYFLLDAIGQREEARTAGRFLLEDFAQAIARRLPLDDYALLIVDEYPQLAGAGEAARLFEQVRSPHGRGGAGVFVGAQSYAGLGADADRMIQAASTTVLFRGFDSERLVLRAGQRLVPRRGYTVGQGTALGRAQPATAFPVGQGRHETFSQREEQDYVLSPDAIRQLQIGACVLVPSGGYQHVQVSRVGLSAEARAAAAQALLPKPLIVQPGRVSWIARGGELPVTVVSAVGSDRLGDADIVLRELPDQADDAEGKVEF